MQELARMIGAEKYGQRPPLQTIWAESEDSGHEIGKIVATEFDQIMQRPHAEHYDQTRPCPQCGKDCHRIDYPAGCTAGLPTSNFLIESQVEEMNHRVKVTEKFWYDSDGGEAILQMRAAIISDDDALLSHIGNYPSSDHTRQLEKDGQLEGT